MKKASVLSLIGGVILWELVARFIVKSTLIIVPPSHVVRAFVDLVRQGELQTHDQNGGSCLCISQSYRDADENTCYDASKN